MFGQLFGFLIGFSALAGGFYLVYAGKDGAGFIIAGAGLAPLVAAYIWSEYKALKKSGGNAEVEK